MEDLDGAVLKTMVLEAPEQVVQLPSNRLRLKICTSFEGPGDSIYEAVFRFEIQAED